MGPFPPLPLAENLRGRLCLSMIFACFGRWETASTVPLYGKITQLAHNRFLSCLTIWWSSKCTQTVFVQALYGFMGSDYNEPRFQDCFSYFGRYRGSFLLLFSAVEVTLHAHSIIPFLVGLLLLLLSINAIFYTPIWIALHKCQVDYIQNWCFTRRISLRTESGRLIND